MILCIWLNRLRGVESQRSQRFVIQFTRDLKTASDLKACNSRRCFVVVFSIDFPVVETRDLSIS